MDKRIEIISDEQNIVTYDTITRDTINREDVRVAKERIEVLEKEIAEKTAEMEALIASVKHAEEVIAIADAKKLVEQQAALTEEEVIGG